MTQLPRLFGPGRARRVAFICCAVVALIASPASAVVIINTDGTANNGQTSAAGTTAPYANVGLRANGGASITYLGNDWAITANHVYMNTVGSTINGPDGPYVVPNTPQSTITDAENNPITVDNYVTLNGQQITINSATEIYNSDGSPTDLKLIHLTSDPGLPSIQLASSYTTANAPVTMIGAGEDLGTQQTYTFDSQNYTGYNLLSSEDVTRWGTNDVTPWTTTHSDVDLGIQNGSNQEEYEYVFATTFGNTPSASNQEAQVTNGDSGGGVFEEIGGTWYLVGIIDGLSNVPMGSTPSDYENNVFQQSSNFSGEQSIMADIGPYNGIIAGMVPEPSSSALVSVGIGFTLGAGLRARRRRLAGSPSLAAE